MDVTSTDQRHRRVIGRYMLHDEIASGGMATVRFGRLLGPVGFSRTVAVKCLHAQFAKDPEFARMFLDEARLAARVRHPNVVPILDVVSLEGELFLVMEYVQGESFSRLLRSMRAQGKRIPPKMVATIMSGVLEGLHAAHEAKSEQGEALGIVHRDVSPQNVMVGLDGVARVLDFGVAKAAGRLQTTREGQLKGKLAYMSPEQLKATNVDRRTDIYAASVVLWEALTGKRLFKADDEVGIFGLVLEGKVDPPTKIVPTLHRGFDDVTLRGLARDVDTRYSTAQEMAIDLERVVGLASPREVGRWVEQHAGATLQKRAEQLAEIESVSSLSMPSYVSEGVPPSVELGTEDLVSSKSSASAVQAASAIHGPSSARLPPPKPPPRPEEAATREMSPDMLAVALQPSIPAMDVEPTLISDTTGSAVHLANAQQRGLVSGSQMTSLSMVQPQPVSRSRPKLIVAMLGGAVVALLAIIGMFIFFPRGSGEGEELGVQPSADPAEVDVEPEFVAMPEETTPEVVPPPPSASTPVEEPDAGVAVAKGGSKKWRPKGGSTKPKGTTASTAKTTKPVTTRKPKVDCNPPYTLDSNGVRIPKPQCL